MQPRSKQNRTRQTHRGRARVAAQGPEHLHDELRVLQGRWTDEQTQDETDYTYNNMNQMTAAGNISYTWDNAGNMATKVVNQQTTTYTWDFRNKLLNVDFPEGDDVSLRYDGDGNRYRKVVGSTTTKFLFDTNLSLSALLFELDGSDTVQARYRRESFGLLLAMKRGATVYTYHFDALGSTRALTNPSETTTDTYEYDAWGNVTASAGSTANPSKYVSRLGYYDDTDVGLVLVGVRYYDVRGGRFVSANPLVSYPLLRWWIAQQQMAVAHANFYWYVDNNPVNFVDRTGAWKQATQCCFNKCDTFLRWGSAGCGVIFAACLTGALIGCAMTGPLFPDCIAAFFKVCLSLAVGCQSAVTVGWGLCTAYCIADEGGKSMGSSDAGRIPRRAVVVAVCVSLPVFAIMIWGLSTHSVAMTAVEGALAPVAQRLGAAPLVGSALIGTFALIGGFVARLRPICRGLSSWAVVAIALAAFVSSARDPASYSWGTVVLNVYVGLLCGALLAVSMAHAIRQRKGRRQSGLDH